MEHQHHISRFTPDATTRAVKKMTMILLVTGLFLMLFQSQSILSWTYDLPETALSQNMIMAFETWHQWMEELGFAEISRVISDHVIALVDLTFDSPQ